ncbi:MAG: iron export ABC transporter permease subunit FetB [Alphaproteobacteria bacterium]
MSNDYIHLSYLTIALASITILINAVLSFYFKLGMEKKLLFAASRMVLQLFLLGFVLKFLFENTSLIFTFIAVFCMLMFAGREAYARQQRKFKGLWSFGLSSGSMTIAASCITIFALFTQISPEPWYNPRYFLPILGMILGNTMNGISLGLDNLTAIAAREKASIEARIALGHTRLEALNLVIRSALRTSFMPAINSMSAIGIVSIPGMMTGQILAGADPVEATKYQMMIMFMIAGSTGLGSLFAVLGGALRITDDRHRLRLDRLRGVYSKNG